MDNWYKDSDIATIRRIVPSEAAAPTAARSVPTTGAAQSVTDLQTAALLSAMRGSAA